MSDSDEGSKIEISAPPKAIEIETSPAAAESMQQPVNQGAMLTGGIGQMSQGNFLSTQPQNVKFVMGPNGQLIAMEKPPFVWKQFLIGGGIPFALYFIPLLIVMIGTGLGFEEDYRGETVEMTKNENSTMYEGEFKIDSDQTLQWCHINFDEEIDPEDYLYCEDHDDFARFFYPDWDGEWVGNWSNEDGVAYFDTGEDYGSKVELEFEYRTHSASQDFFYTVQEFSGVTCCLGFILSIVMLIVGFSQGKPGMGWGGVSALVALPVATFLAFVTLW